MLDIILQDFAEFVTRLDYPDAIDKVVKTRAESLVKAYITSKEGEDIDEWRNSV